MSTSPYNIFLVIFLLYYVLTLVTDTSYQTAAGIGQPLRMDQLGNMEAMIESICVGRLTLCQDLMTIVNATEMSVNQAQTELQAGNSTGVTMMLNNAQQILSALRGNMTVMVGGR